MKWLLEMLKGVVIGLANIIPGVSGGTMMVSMGIYDTLIHCITHLFSELKKSIITLLPYGVGMLLAIIVGAFGLKAAFANFPLPTNTLFIGLILGSVPAIIKQMMSGGKPDNKGFAIGAVIFAAFFAIVVLLKVFEAENSGTITLSVLEVVKLFLLGCIASATMVIPGVSGSMILKTLGYYEPVVTVAIPDLVNGLRAMDFGVILHNVGILLPFGLGVVFGIFAIAKIIEVLMARFKFLTYCAIMGMVIASPVVILMDGSIYAGANVLLVVVSVIMLAIGLLVAFRMSGEPEKK